MGLALHLRGGQFNMKAVTSRRYGPPEVLKVEDIPVPLPKPNEVRVRVEATSVTSGDARLRGFTKAGIFWLPLRLMFGVLRPRYPISGMEFAGTIDAAGDAVTEFKIGDAVFGKVLRGANAEYLNVPADGQIAIRPVGLSCAQAAAVPFGAIAALAFLRDIARLKFGEKILIVGASGSVGVFAVQLARHFGATVTAVCSGANAALVSELGAHKVINYTTEDFNRRAELYDIILDTVGVTRFSRCRQTLSPKGRHVFVSSQFREICQAVWTSLRPGKRVICGFSGGSKADLKSISALIEKGILKPVVDREIRLEEIVEAHRYVETGRKRGSLIISIAADGP